MIYRVKKQRLADICEVQTGYTVKTRMEPIADGGIPAIQLRDLSGEVDFDPAGLPSYPLPMSFDRYSARPGDLLFRSRGDRNTAVVVSPNCTSAAVAVLPLLVLRPKRDLIDPRYLAWFINQPASQAYFDKYAHGQTLKMVPKACLDDLQVAVPDLHTQQLIVQVDALARREHTLTQQLAGQFELTTLPAQAGAKLPAPCGSF